MDRPSICQNPAGSGGTAALLALAQFYPLICSNCSKPCGHGYTSPDEDAAVGKKKEPFYCSVCLFGDFDNLLERYKAEVLGEVGALGPIDLGPFQSQFLPLDCENCGKNCAMRYKDDKTDMEPFYCSVCLFQNYPELEANLLNLKITKPDSLEEELLKLSGSDGSLGIDEIEGHFSFGADGGGPGPRTSTPNVEYEYNEDGKKIVPIYYNANMAAMNKEIGWAGIGTYNKIYHGRRTHLNSPTDFFVQDGTMALRTDKMNNFFDSIESCDLVPLKDLKIGTLCLAQGVGPLSGVMGYLRAEVVELGAAKCRVFYLDSGSTGIKGKKELYELPVPFNKVPRQVVNYCWDLALAGELPPERIKAIMKDEVLAYVPRIQIGPGQYLISIGKLEVTKTEFKCHDMVDPAHPYPSYGNYNGELD